MITGTVKHWNVSRAFGFIRRDDGQPDIFVHINELADGIDELQLGQRVQFEPGIGGRSGKPEARDVRLID